MAKFYNLQKTSFEFRNDDVSYEFNEYVDFIFLGKNTLFVVFFKTITKEQSKNQRSHIKKYYADKGERKVKFLYF